MKHLIISIIIITTDYNIFVSSPIQFCLKEILLQEIFVSNPKTLSIFEDYKVMKLSFSFFFFLWIKYQILIIDIFDNKIFHGIARTNFGTRVLFLSNRWKERSNFICRWIRFRLPIKWSELLWGKEFALAMDDPLAS